jgi:hypothetical protein
MPCSVFPCWRYFTGMVAGLGALAVTCLVNYGVG